MTKNRSQESSALFVTTSMAILTSVFPPKRCGRAIGFYVAAVYICLSFGPFAGGLLNQYLGWRSVFAVVVPFGIASVWITLRFLQGEWAGARGEKLDITGSLLYAASVFLLVYGASLRLSQQAVLLILIGAAALVVFVRFELQALQPVFEVRLFSGNRCLPLSAKPPAPHISLVH